MIFELSTFAKSLQGDSGPKRILGSELISKLTNLNFGQGVHFPFVILSAIELQLATLKVVDGKCVFLTPSNLVELTKPENRSAVEQSESLMKEARSLVRALGVPKHSVTKLIARFDVRLCAMLTKKSKGLEGTEGFVESIAGKFVTALSQISGQVVEWSFAPNTDTAGAASTAASSGTSAPDVHHMDTLEQKTNPVFQAHKLGFTPGTFVINRTSMEAQVFKLESFSGKHAKLVLQTGGHGGAHEFVDVDVVLKNWRVHKGTVTALLANWDYTFHPCNPLATKAMLYEIAKSRITIAMADIYGKCEMYHAHIEMLTKPNSVRVTSDFEPGKFALAPCTTKFERRKTDSTFHVGVFDLGDGAATPLYIGSMFTAPMTPQGTPNKTPWVCPFCQVQFHKDGPFNMELKVYDGGNGVRIPVLVNSKTLVPGIDLKCDKKHAAEFASKRAKFDITEAAAPVAKKART